MYFADVENFVGALKVESPNVFLDPAATVAFLTSRLADLIQAGVVTAEQVAELAEGLVSVPVGVVTPDQFQAPDLLLSSRNFGSASYWGADLSAQVLASDRVTVTAGYSFQSKECFDFDGMATAPAATTSP